MKRVKKLILHVHIFVDINFNTVKSFEQGIKGKKSLYPLLVG